MINLALSFFFLFNTTYLSGRIYKGTIRVYANPLFTKHEKGKIKGSGNFKIIKKGKKCREGYWYKLQSGAWVCSGWFIVGNRRPDKLTNWNDYNFTNRWYGGKGKITWLAQNLRLLGKGKFLKLRKLRGFLPLEKKFIGGFPYFRLFNNGYVPVNKLIPYKPTELQGINVKRHDLPLIFVKKVEGAAVYRKKAGKYVQTGTLDHYAIRQIIYKSGKKYLRLKKGKNLYILRDDVSIAFNKSVSPPSIVGKDENWVDIDLKENIIYAYRGKTIKRVFLSSGSDLTPVGTFYVYWKLVYQTFDRHRGKDAYYLESVPWVLFFKESYGIHGAYWHDKFGIIKTHGCINVSPTDGKWLFNFIGPKLPMGYVSRRYSKKSKGGVIRLRR